ncbi:hypothetical protein SAMN04487898_11279 [Pedobacter sp. ok626]|uniref:DUF6600 domain-containing protein n=1 Tax=Pedobacter sp. ok626 TaxID=1761882 RepID=UPI0008915E9F|nr:DUF6600 domain-containing protein [Pedobacter sp. ok626]SDK82845.1 hypothetical protein SAMN04487898_11279 [Pedobacter sp. ok626]
MKNMIKLPAIVLGLLLMLTGTTQKVMAQGDDVSLQSFYDELSPYGTWIQDPQYGYVWRPDVGQQSDFRPYYTNGRWVMTEYGNTWVSNYDWGWAPFHYGRWVYNNYNEWVWIPDTTWGPAWVSWRSGDGYYGWAPMGPGMNINISFNIPSLWWVFIPQRNIYYDSFPRYYSRRNTVYINNTVIINNTYVRNSRTYYSGPRADDIRRATRQDVRVYNLNNTGRPSRTNISGNSVNIYTPRPSRGNSNVNARPREAIRQEGATAIRGDRNPAGNGSVATGRPSRGENQGNVNRPSVTRPEGNTRPTEGNSSRPGRTEYPQNPGSRPQRPEGVTPGRENPAQRPQQVNPSQPQVERPTRQERPTQQPQMQPQQQQRPETPRPERQERPQRQESRPVQQPQQQQQRPEAPRPQRQEQPQRQESRPAPQQQQQRPERVQQQQPQRSSEGRGNQGGGERPARGGRN